VIKGGVSMDSVAEVLKELLGGGGQGRSPLPPPPNPLPNPIRG